MWWLTGNTFGAVCFCSASWKNRCQVLLIDFGSVWFFSTCQTQSTQAVTEQRVNTPGGASIQSDFLTVTQSSPCHPQRSASCLFMLQKAAAFTSSCSEERASVRFMYLFILWGCVFLGIPCDFLVQCQIISLGKLPDSSVTCCSIMSEHISAFSEAFFSISFHLLGLIQLFMRRRTEILLLGSCLCLDKED